MPFPSKGRNELQYKNKFKKIEVQIETTPPRSFTFRL